eukprot:2446077-Prymnesium_polylepis.1
MYPGASIPRERERQCATPLSAHRAARRAPPHAADQVHPVGHALLQAALARARNGMDLHRRLARSTRRRAPLHCRGAVSASRSVRTRGGAVDRVRRAGMHTRVAHRASCGER